MTFLSSSWTPHLPPPLGGEKNWSRQSATSHARPLVFCASTPPSSCHSTTLPTAGPTIFCSHARAFSEMQRRWRGRRRSRSGRETTLLAGQARILYRTQTKNENRRVLCSNLIVLTYLSTADSPPRGNGRPRLDVTEVIGHRPRHHGVDCAGGLPNSR